MKKTARMKAGDRGDGPASAGPSRVTADGRSLRIDGQRRFIISGEIHYPRVPRAEWERVLDRTKEAGVNCVATYVFWSLHEPRPGVYDFSGQADLGEFLRLCRERELYCLVRMGPYCCAEWNFGGFPAWLRDVPGIALRTWNQPYLVRVRNYFRVLVAYLLPHLISRGGNVFLVQVENEYNNVAKRYGAEGVRYLAWVVKYVKSLGIDVPTLTCEGGAPGAIEGINGFGVYDVARRHRQKHPDMPLLWTENWPSWYDTWGSEHHVRDPHENGYEILRFVAAGGSGFNYYMWHGGTNFGRSAMYLQTTSYEFGGPLGEWGEPTEKVGVLAPLHRGLLENQEILLSGQKQGLTFDNKDIFAVKWSAPAGVCVISVNAGESAFEIALPVGPRLLHPARSACLWRKTPAGFELVWKSWPNAKRKKFTVPKRDEWKPLTGLPAWQSFAEPRPSARRDGVLAKRPLEQLLLTQDQTDYCWYSTDIRVNTSRHAQLQIERGGDFFHVFLNGRLIDRTSGPLLEIRGPTVSSQLAPVIAANHLEEGILRSGRNSFAHTFTIPLQRGQNRLEILACALGLIKGDWQLALSMQHERKGIWDKVRLDRKELFSWRHHPGLVGEKMQLSDPAAPEFSTLAWEKQKRSEPLAWHLLDFELSPRQLQSDLVWAFEPPVGLKGMLWLNGRSLGRVWQIPAHGAGADPLPPTITTVGAGQPTQKYYRIPASWLLARNRLLLFSEDGSRPSAKSVLFRQYRNS